MAHLRTTRQIHLRSTSPAGMRCRAPVPRLPDMHLIKAVNRSAHLTDHAVVIVEGDPTGLTLAGELALAGIDVAIVERRATIYVAVQARGE
jgi:hypothetical protein